MLFILSTKITVCTYPTIWPNRPKRVPDVPPKTSTVGHGLAGNHGAAGMTEARSISSRYAVAPLPPPLEAVSSFYDFETGRSMIEVGNEKKASKAA